jgi:hypothetical protein
MEELDKDEKLMLACLMTGALDHASPRYAPHHAKMIYRIADKLGVREDLKAVAGLFGQLDAAKARTLAQAK